MESCEIAVVGLGGIGSAIAAECAARGAEVVGLEQFARGHELGSSSGKTRLFRKAYFEDERYVPLLHRAEEMWRALEADGGEELLRTTGLLLAGGEGSALVQRSYEAARVHRLPVERLRAAEVAERFPMVKLEAGEDAILEPAAGVLKPEAGIEAHLRKAEKAGAKLMFERAVKGWERDGERLVVRFANGEIAVKKLVLAIGPWFAQQMAKAGMALKIQRNVQAWFEPAAESRFTPPEFPAFLIDRAGMPAALYGFPDFGDGLKSAFHGCGSTTDPASVKREIDFANDIAPLQRETEKFLPGSTSRYLGAKVCLYSLTPDENFVIDFHPQDHDVLLCGGFSGHGYKFAPVIGEIAAELAMEGKSRLHIDFLSLARFRKK